MGLARIHAHVAVHAIGDRAVSEALAACTDTNSRENIEHVQLPQSQPPVVAPIPSVPRLRSPGHAHR